MSYQVLARKWRPATFQEMVGQEHVLKALVNALDDDRLHHAYLFTGTRGVGKTSIARLFAKSLNCANGVSSSPCGVCAPCQEISEGRFVDLIEVDAASRTKVEDTRELLENVQYAPTHGRYKVYLIDEVHMLSTHSFNALLKTLEEPPPHVKFLLATTDPQKLPVTILSRCLQFNLKNMIPERIVDHLRHVLTQESIKFEEPALWLLARSADGSMRDAMSLTDQAIAFGAGEINEADARSMLGTIDQRLVYRLLDSLVAQNAKDMLATVSDLAQFSPDYNTVLGDLISLLHRIALGQVMPDAVDNGMGDRDQVLELARQLSAEDVQLYYQVALLGRKDLPYVPDAREGLEMVMLRMLAFRPASAPPRSGDKPQSASAVSDGEAEPAADTQNSSQSTAPAASPVVENVAAPAVEQTAEAVPAPPVIPAAGPAEAPAVAAQPEVPVQRPQPVTEPPVTSLVQEQVQEAEPPVAAEPVQQPVTETVPVAQEPVAVQPQQSAPVHDVPPWEEPPAYDESYFSGAPQEASEPSKKPEEMNQPSAAVAQSAAVAEQPAPAVTAAPTNVADGYIAEPVAEKISQQLAELDVSQWVLLVDELGLSGMTYMIAANTSLEAVSEGVFRFHYADEQRNILNEVHTDRISAALSDYFQQPLQVEFELGIFSRETPSLYRSRKKSERLAQAVTAIETDATVQAIIERFGGRIDISSVAPIDAPVTLH
ncbi:DNA polymerase III subunit gamma/tau [Aliamphritea spongicola]|uniref:DNA polymerase III subunit gamma/tau n=1 Tax=Aliamphritea spongicola TaxID=707589 RepID=UPI00196A72BD|nr:DNA polymerase III subunit gamma/tau [Aliamphritea spongicola]MBN3563428.1 DNA polymerase III subunit gamma/tau [Aliamphritea spongicola]